MNWQCLCGTYVREKRFCPRCKLLRFKLERTVILDNFHLKLGTISGNLPFNLPLSRINGHVLVSGQTGTGKSRFAMNMAVKAENYQQIIPARLLVIDVEGEWRGIIPYLKNGSVLYDAKHNLRLNPFDLNDPALIRDLFKETVFKGMEQEFSDLSAQMNFVLNDVISKSANVAELIKNIKKYQDQKLSALERTKTALLVRLQPFTQTPLREIFFCKKSTIDFETIDEKNIIIDLHSLDANVSYKNELRLIYNIISSYYLRKMLNRGTRSFVSNIFVCDEAQLLVPKILRKLIVTESWPATEFATRLRKRGCGLVLITQSPSNIETDIFKNCGTKITFRLQHAEDIKLISESCGFVDQTEYQYMSDRFVRLPLKQAIVSTTDHEPFLITSDDFVPSGDLTPIHLADEEMEIEEYDDEEMLLENIEKEPFLPVRKRRVSLGWNDKKYYRVLDSLLRKGKIETQSVKLGRGAPIILYQKPGKTPSIRHEFYVHWIKEKFPDARTNVKEGPDVVIPGLDIAVEVELGKSDMHLNMRKDADNFNKVIVCSDEKKVIEALSRENKLSNVLFLPVQKVPDCIKKMQEQNELKHI